MADIATVNSVLVAGGCGFIGRNLVEYIVNNDLAARVKVVDMNQKDFAYMSSEHLDAFESDIVECVQSDLDLGDNAQAVFEGENFDIVFNCTGTSNHESATEILEAKIVSVTVKLAEAAAAAGVTNFVTLSSCEIYKSGSSAHAENAKLNPWTVIAEYEVAAEEAVAAVSGINPTTFRLPVVYGPGDQTGLMPRLVIAAVYKTLGQKMKVLWNDSTAVNTVHVRDVVRAMWHAANADEATGKTYNLVDDNETTQEKIHVIIQSIFGIEIECVGRVQSTFAMAKLTTATEIANKKHMGPWFAALQANGMSDSPLSPALSPELLHGNHLSVDGTAFKNDTGFEYEETELTEDLVREALDYWIFQGLFPADTVE